MTEEKRPDEQSAPEERIAVAPLPEEQSAPETHVSAAPLSETAEPQPIDEIELEHLQEQDTVLPMESVPPYDQRADVPADVEKLREATKRTRPPVIDNEKRYGPFSGSMWFLGLAVVAFVLSVLFALLN